MRTLWKALLLSCCLANAAHAQELPPLFQKASRSVTAVEVIASFPTGTFLENLVTTPAGDLYVTSYEEGILYKIATGKKPAVFAKLPGNVAGIVREQRGSFLLTGKNERQQQVVYRVGKKGDREATFVFPDALFLNGITSLSGDSFLIADSYRGVIWLLDARSGKKSVWLDSPLLTRDDDKNPTPGANGVKVYKDKILVTNTQRHTLVSVPLLNGNKPGTPTVQLTGVNLDDFAADTNGNLYATTHIYDSIVRIGSKGDMQIIADGIFGTTSAQFGQGANRDYLYVTTNGGMSFPPKNGVQKAQVVRLKIMKNPAKR